MTGDPSGRDSVGSSNLPAGGVGAVVVSACALSREADVARVMSGGVS